MKPPEKPKDDASAKAAWARVAAELDRRGRGIQWLADELDTSVQRVQNWTTRGLPGRLYVQVAAALGESADWIVGMAEPKWKAAKTEPSERDRLSAAGVAVGAAYDRMTPAQREQFIKLLEVAFGADPRERPEELAPKELGHSDIMDLDIDLSDKQQATRKGKQGGIDS